MVMSNQCDVEGGEVVGVTSVQLMHEAPALDDDMTIAVLLCDDHPTFAKGLAPLLADEGDDIEVVGVATGGAEAERLVRELRPDVVLMDVRMPGVDGIEATRRIRAASHATRVVMLTVSDDEVDLYRAVRAGASGWVSKSRDSTELAAVIRAVSHGHLVLPADLGAGVLTDLMAGDAMPLSDEERALLSGFARGATNLDLAAALHLSERTLRRRIEQLYSKLDLTDRLHAALWAREHGFGGPSDHGRDGGR